MEIIEGVRLSLGEIRGLAERVLVARGCDPENAAAIAENMTMAERDGAKSHGLFRLPGHVALLEARVANGRARPSVRQSAPAVLAGEGDCGFASVAHPVVLPPLAALARETGIAALSLRRTVHFAALWPETERLASEGLVALAMTSSPPYVTAAGGRRPVFGTNPMSFAWPRPGGGAMVWDQASAAMARGELQIHARDGRPVSKGAGIDAEGQPTTDPKAILEGGAQCAFGGYKGAAIALMVDLLAGPLLDEVTSLEAGASASVGGPQLGGEILIAIDPGRFGGPSGLARAEALFAELGREDGVRLPGDRRLGNRARSETEGVVVPTGLHGRILELLES